MIDSLGYRNEYVEDGTYPPQRHMTDSLGYWNEYVEDGSVLEKADWDDGTEEVTVTLTRGDLEQIDDALRRKFIAVKNGRSEVLHAVSRVRRALS